MMKRLVVLLGILWQATTAYTQAPAYPWKTLGYDSTYMPGQLWLKGNLAVPGGKVKVGTGNNAPSAAFQVNDTAKGILIPRMTAGQMAAISAPATGLIIYNTSVNAFHFYNGSAWMMIGGGAGGSGGSVAVTPNRIVYSANDSTLTTDNGMTVTDSTILISRTEGGVTTALAIGKVAEAFGMQGAGFYISDSVSFSGGFSLNTTPFGGESNTVVLVNAPLGLGGAAGSSINMGKYNQLSISFSDTTEKLYLYNDLRARPIRYIYQLPYRTNVFVDGFGKVDLLKQRGRYCSFPDTQSHINHNSFYPFGEGVGNNNAVLAFGNSGAQAKWMLNYDPNFMGSCQIDTAFTTDGKVAYTNSGHKTLCINGERFSDYNIGTGAGGNNVFLGPGTSFRNISDIHSEWSSASYNTFVGTEIRPDSASNGTYIGYRAGSSQYRYGSTAIGSQALVSHDNSIALGNGAFTSKDYQFALPSAVVNAKLNGVEYELPYSLADTGSILMDVGGGKLEWQSVPRTKKYVATLNQTGTADPVATELENTIGAVTWSRTGVGVYTLDLTGAFTVGKTIVRVNTLSDEGDMLTAVNVTANQVLFYMVDAALGSCDCMSASHGNLSVEIVVYP